MSPSTGSFASSGLQHPRLRRGPQGSTPYVPTCAGASGSGLSGQSQGEAEIQGACGTPSAPARWNLGPEMLVQLERFACEILGRQCQASVLSARSTSGRASPN